MPLHWTLQLGLIGIIVSALGLPAAAQQKIDSRYESLDGFVDQLLEKAAAVNDFHRDPPAQVPDLIKIVETGEGPQSDWAILALAGMKAKAAPAIRALCGKLDATSHATRSNAVDALVAIGEPAVEPLRKLLQSPAARARAAATAALGRLQRIDPAELDQLAKDADPRVRAAVADCSHTGAAGAGRLAELLARP